MKRIKGVYMGMFRLTNEISQKIQWNRKLLSDEFLTHLNKPNENVDLVSFKHFPLRHLS